MSFETLVETVLNPALCASCGLCESVCPKDIIHFTGVTPEFKDEAEACGDCALCSDICPGAFPDTARLETGLFGRPRKPNERWLGIHREVLGCYATDAQVNARSASGGSITELLLSAKDMLGLDAILAVGRELERPGRATGHLFETREDLLEACQSTYQLFPYLRILKRLLTDTDKECRIAMVGLGCHVQAIRKMQALDNELGVRARGRIAFVVEAACSSNTLPEGTDSLLRTESGVSLDDVKSLRYRDGPYPGEISAETEEGERVTIAFWKAVHEFKRFKTHRCLSCGDWFSGLADVAVCDGDPNIFRTSLNGSEGLKYGTVLPRTEAGLEVIRWAVTEGRLAAWPTNIDEENLGCERKRHRRRGYEQSGMPIPEGPIPDYFDQFNILDDDELLSGSSGKISR
ncbi:Coenzyme F420 hydrogenase/dehydrogenase, beta subunit C-terminal domain [Roseibium alexandrii]|uniref:Coenzyme F420 hydrogenase/dehydrogenase, beta subunit C-terminal domain n=1 Tax=Roseibium alexandrii TaxID=388408 RepID=UPI0037505432